MGFPLALLLYLFCTVTTPSLVLHSCGKVQLSRLLFYRELFGGNSYSFWISFHVGLFLVSALQVMLQAIDSAVARSRHISCDTQAPMSVNTAAAWTLNPLSTMVLPSASGPLTSNTTFSVKSTQYYIPRAYFRSKYCRSYIAHKVRVVKANQDYGMNDRGWTPRNQET